MDDRGVAYCKVQTSMENPCTGRYTILMPAVMEGREDGAGRLARAKLDGVALRKGTYKVSFERTGD